MPYFAPLLFHHMKCDLLEIASLIWYTCSTSDGDNWRLLCCLHTPPAAAFWVPLCSPHDRTFLIELNRVARKQRSAGCARAQRKETRRMKIITPSEQVDFAHNKQLLNRYRFVE